MMQDAGYRMQDTNPMGRFPARSSVLGIRSSASIESRVSGTRCQVAGPRHLEPGTGYRLSSRPGSPPL
jgi:hypothetical protein